ncbi:magnesium chelatase subunit H [Aestuariivirga sp.]|uniref:magnesium chelatase subunit H n=1 Tax=Aestuariivirga sp. TaxID=2650926 RepID=UPI0025BE73C0|nr:magnesium chelatase subunit H [Aestuariivirga sp.]MCA3555771.1 magnesium chelatase subunit H [Aestuariivirga sp.]
MPKHTTADRANAHVVIVTLDNHITGAVARVNAQLAREMPGLTLSVHAASSWGASPDSLAACIEDIGKGDIIIATMLFMEDHIQAVMPALQARRDACDAMVCFMSAGEVIKLTRAGRFAMNGSQGAIVNLLKKLRGSKTNKDTEKATAGQKQLAMLKRLPKILRFIPGSAQDMRAYFLAMQYWLAGSEENIGQMVRFLVSRFAEGPRRSLRGISYREPQTYPEVGVYHPRLATRMSETADALPSPPTVRKGTVGLLLMRSYVLSGDTAHYDGVIAAFESRGLKVIPAFATGLDQRPAIERFFMKNGKPAIDALVSLSGFSLVGGPAYNDARAAEDMLVKLDVPYLAAQPVEFQTLEEWEESERGLHPIETTMMIAIPELDGAGGGVVFGGRSVADHGERGMRVHAERASMLASRVAKQVALRLTAKAERKIAIVLFNFPPNAGAVGTAAFLSVFESLFNTLTAMKADGYDVEVPASVDELQARILKGNAERFGSDANVIHRVPADDHVRRETHLREIEAQWGPAPGRQQADGSSIHVLGERFGNVLVGIQPAFGYEGDPMRLLFEKSFTPTHAFSAFYRYLREDFGASAVLHFGTHGALEFMPGKQSGLSAQCWPDRLIGDLPNLYLYAANNPSEGAIAKRRAGATLVSYLTPPLAQAGLYRGLADLKASIGRWRGLDPTAAERHDLALLIQAQAATVDLAAAEPEWDDAEVQVRALQQQILELEYTLIPHGLHVVGQAMDAEARRETLASVAEAGTATDLAEMDRLLSEDHEISGLLKALDARFIRPVAGGDLIRSPDILPTGRNLHGFDPFRIPSAFAVKDGARQAQLLLDTHVAAGKPLPETVALVLWGTDNLKSEGGPIAQALALLGAAPRFDSFGRLCGASLLALEELGRPRIDVMLTLSGIFRDLLPLQTRMLAEACWLAASADEPETLNFVRKHAREHMKTTGCGLETAALRVFSNADGAYGSNVNMLVDSGRWEDGDELGDLFAKRKSFAHGRDGQVAQQPALMASVLSGVDLAYQNLESVELGVTTIDHYFDSLGGISRAAEKQRGEAVPVYIGDQTRGVGVVRTLADQVALESRTRVLNPKWYEGMLKHGHEGVRHIECHLTNTVGWSATTGQVAPWVYQQFTQTYVLDETMRDQLASLNPKAAMKVVNRLLEAQRRDFWSPDAETLAALERAGEELEDRLEGIGVEVAA